jgi:hypothetical protein
MNTEKRNRCERWGGRTEGSHKTRGLQKSWLSSEDVLAEIFEFSKDLLPSAHV